MIKGDFFIGANGIFVADPGRSASKSITSSGLFAGFFIGRMKQHLCQIRYTADSKRQRKVCSACVFVFAAGCAANCGSFGDPASQLSGGRENLEEIDSHRKEVSNTEPEETATLQSHY